MLAKRAHEIVGESVDRGLLAARRSHLLLVGGSLRTVKYSSLLAIASLAAFCACSSDPAEPSTARRAQAVASLGWHTSGTAILTADGEPFRIEAVNWYGFETRDAVAHGLYAVDLDVMLQYIADAGFNTIRIPFSNEMWETNPIVRDGLVSACSACQGMTSRDILALVINGAGAKGLHVILDNHRSAKGNSAEANGLWYTAAYPEQEWIQDWQDIQAWVNGVPGFSSVALSADAPRIVIGFDLRNEPHTPARTAYLEGGATWGVGDHDSVANPNPNPFAVPCAATSTCVDWRLAAERAGSTLMGDAAANGWAYPLIVVEGVGLYLDENGVEQNGWWGGMLKGVNGNAAVPGAAVVFNEGGDSGSLGAPVDNQLVYSAHDYGPDLYAQDWFGADTCYEVGCTGTSLAALWNDRWGYLTHDIDPVWSGGSYPWGNTGHAGYSVAPVLVGEFGTKNTDADLTSSVPGSQGQWFTAMVNFIQASSETNPGNDPAVPVSNLHWAYWALNGNDDYSILDRKWKVVANPAKVDTFLCAIESQASCAAPLPPANGGTQGSYCGDGTCDSDETACDCADCVVPEVCDDGIDNDCDLDLDCADSECSSDPACTCGNATCEPPSESSCTCPDDCGLPDTTESSCTDGIDDDCDEAVDCDDADCSEDAACQVTCGGNKSPCSVPTDCCSGNCVAGACRGG